MCKILLAILFTLFTSLAFATEVAITIDDLPVHGPQSQVFSRKKMFEKMLKAFKKHKVPPVYGFINGQGLIKEPEDIELLKEWINAGNKLANHTFSHINLSKTTSDIFVSDLLKNEPILRGLEKEKDFKFFRYPFLIEGEALEKREKVRTLLSDNGYQIAEVTIAFEDYIWNRPYLRCLDQRNFREAKSLEESYLKYGIEGLKTAERLSNIIFGRNIKQILLVHIGAMNAQAMDALLSEYEKAGVKFIPLQEALDDDSYKIDPKWVSDAGELYLDQLMQSRSLKYPGGGRSYPFKELENTCIKN